MRDHHYFHEVGVPFHYEIYCGTVMPKEEHKEDKLINSDERDLKEITTGPYNVIWASLKVKTNIYRHL